MTLRSFSTRNGVGHPLVNVLCAAGVAIGIPLLASPAAAQSLRSSESIGTSRGNQSINVITLGNRTPDGNASDHDDRPAIAIIAGLDGRHTAGPRIAQAIAAELERNHQELLDTRTIYIVPMVNPDGQGGLTGRNMFAFDADRDGRVNEDGGEDLNGDGLITMMRVRRPSPSTGLSATMVAEPGESRLLRQPDASKNEIAEFAVLTEGRDDDGDGRYNEDGPNGDGGGGVVLDHQFTAFWPEHNEAAGRYPLSEPETRAIADWLLGRDNIQAVYVLTASDTLLNTLPKGQYDPAGRLPVGLEPDDEQWHKKIASVFSNVTGEGKGLSGDHRGSLRTWVYAELGLWSFSHPSWTRPAPEQAESESETKEAEDSVESAAAPEAPNLAAELRERGVPPEMIAFLSATPAERQAMMTDFENASPEDRQARMAQIQMLPDELRARVFAIAQGMPDPGAPAAQASTNPGGGDDAPGASDDSMGDDTAWMGTEDGKWLTYSSDVRGGTGFIDWTPFDHPQLGPVEIGGFVPGFKLNPPADQIEGIAAAQADFVSELAGMLADITIPTPEVERVGPGLWRIRVSIENTGTLPTASAIARKARRLPPELLVLETPPEVILSGARVQRFESVAGGDRGNAEWMITSRDGSSVDVTLRSARFGNRIIRVRLVEDE